MNQKIFHTASSKEFFTPERCHITEVMNPIENITFSIAQARVEPGVVTQLHALKETDEAYYILSGEGEMEVDGKILGKVKSGDVIWIPKEKSQRIKNVGMDDLIFLCICSPKFKVDVYENLEH